MTGRRDLGLRSNDLPWGTIGFGASVVQVHDDGLTGDRASKHQPLSHDSAAYQGSKLWNEVRARFAEHPMPALVRLDKEGFESFSGTLQEEPPTDFTSDTRDLGIGHVLELMGGLRRAPASPSKHLLIRATEMSLPSNADHEAFKLSGRNADDPRLSSVRAASPEEQPRIRLLWYVPEHDRFEATRDPQERDANLLVGNTEITQPRRHEELERFASRLEEGDHRLALSPFHLHSHGACGREKFRLKSVVSPPSELKQRRVDRCGPGFHGVLVHAPRYQPAAAKSTFTGLADGTSREPPSAR